MDSSSENVVNIPAEKPHFWRSATSRLLIVGVVFNLAKTVLIFLDDHNQLPGNIVFVSLHILSILWVPLIVIAGIIEFFMKRLPRSGWMVLLLLIFIVVFFTSCAAGFKYVPL